ncbi:MAG: hypothetical protein R8G66_15910 [Cytophagales bacterium]|nr:hypothetical protein [Cytophagales bacterium]
MKNNSFEHRSLVPGENISIKSTQNGGSLIFNLLNLGNQPSTIRITFAGSSILVPVPANSSFGDIIYNQSTEVIITNTGQVTFQVLWSQNPLVHCNEI